ncbi:hypothetical protein E2C01_027912 [Portunus trituberculatus]|uniref:Uncharacterized protein n=1 Tax=Portunus trituberculatus TaxID=210409 RepID=A0A5B7EMX3_PORTR|nr:hypothetical protein [Portunus trituberculatus]
MLQLALVNTLDQWMDNSQVGRSAKQERDITSPFAFLCRTGRVVYGPKSPPKRIFGNYLEPGYHGDM